MAVGNELGIIMGDLKGLRKLLSENDNRLNESTILPIYVYLANGGRVADYENQEELKQVLKRFKELVS